MCRRLADISEEQMVADNEIVRELREWVGVMCAGNHEAIGIADEAVSVALRLLDGEEPDENGRRTLVGSLHRLRETLAACRRENVAKRPQIEETLTQLNEQMGRV
jgi:hypothetical protein